MQAANYLFTSSDGAQLFVYKWMPDSTPRAIIHIAHGIAEHAGRYHRFAGDLAARGYAVFADDHRGHGRTAGARENLGHFADYDGWNRVFEDLRLLIEAEIAALPGLPVVLFGHSLGSFLAQQFLYTCGDLLSGCVLSGSGGRLDARYYFLKCLAHFERFRLGRRGRSTLIHRIGLYSANRQFQPARTRYDWLTRNSAEIDRCLADPYFGFVCSTQFWVDLLRALKQMLDPANQRRIPKNLPIYIISGAKDPLGDNCRGLDRLIASYRHAGLTNVNYKFYPEGRHEMLNELNRDEVLEDLFAWLDTAIWKIGTAHQPAI